MEEKVKYWILLALSKSSKERGADVTNLFWEERPDFFDFSFGEFWNYLIELEKEGYIEMNKRSMTPAFRIKARGKKEIRELYRSPPSKLYDIIRYFPDLELKDRIENIEIFIFSAIIMITSFLAISTRSFSSPYTVYPSLLILLVSFVFAAGYFTTILYLVLQNLQISFLNWLFDFIEENKRWFGYVLVVLISILGIFILKYLDFSNNEIMGAVIMEIIFLLILNIKKINNYIKSMKLKKEED